MSISFKSFTGTSSNAAIFENEIITDNISSADGFVTFLSPVEFTANVNMLNNSISNLGTLTSTTVNATNVNISNELNGNGVSLKIGDDINLLNNDIFGASNITTDTFDSTFASIGTLNITTEISNTGGDVKINDNLNMNLNNISGINEINGSTYYAIDMNTSTLNADAVTTGTLNVTNNISNSLGNVKINDTLDLNTNNIIGVNSITSTSLSTTTISNPLGNLTINDTLSLNANSIQQVGNIQLSSLSSGANITVNSPMIISSGNELTLQNRTINSAPPFILGLGGSNEIVRSALSNFDIFGRYLATGESNTATSSASLLTFVNKVSMTTAVVQAGTYFVCYNCLATNSDVNRTVELRFQENGVTLNAPLATFANNNGTIEQFVSNYQYYIRTLASAAYTYTLDFRPSGGGTGRISDAKILFYRIS